MTTSLAGTETIVFSAETARPFASPYAGDYLMAIDFTGALLPRLGRAEHAPAFAALEQAE